MAADEPLDEVDERVWAYIRAYDFEKYAWNTEEAAAELGIAPTRVYQALSQIQKVKRRQIFLHFRDGGIHIQTE